MGTIFWIMMWVLGITAYISIATMIGHRLTRRSAISCSRGGEHYNCEHDGWYLFGAFWPIAVPAATAVMAVMGIAYLSIQAVSSPSERRERREKLESEHRKKKERRNQYVERRLERELYGVKKCKYCGSEVWRSGGVWRDKEDSMGCDQWNNPSRAHQVPDELDARLEA